MNSEAYIERRTLLKSLLKYKIALGVAAIILTAFVFQKNKPSGSLSIQTSEHIALISIKDDMHPSKYDLTKLKSIAQNDKIKGLIVEISCPGGTTNEAERLYYAISAIAQKKPTVAKILDTACSAGYLVALSTHHIVAHNTSLTGGVGVLVRLFELGDLNQKPSLEYKHSIGRIRYNIMPSELNEEDTQAMLQPSLNDVYAFFKDIVAIKRNLTSEQVESLADGRVFSGRQAKDLGLIDEIYTQDEQVIDWFVEKHDINKSIRIDSYNILADETDKLEAKDLLDLFSQALKTLVMQGI